MITNHEINRTINERRRKAYNKSNNNVCLCCGEIVQGLEKSHSLPRFILKGISTNGLVYNQRHFSPLNLDGETGINNSGIFKRICAKCENSLFRDYESKSAIIGKTSNRIMAEIDLKNRLKLIDTKMTSSEMLKDLLKEDLKIPEKCNILLKINAGYLDLGELEKEKERDLQIIRNDLAKGFKLIYRAKLKYVTPLAFQGSVALLNDLEGGIINELYNPDVNIVMETLNLCVFPLETETIVIIFTRDDNKNYNTFIRQFRKLKKNQKLRIISYLIFNYSEDFFISKKANNRLMQDKSLALVANDQNNLSFYDGETYQNEMDKQIKHNLYMYKNFPNILSSDNAITK